MKKRLVRRDKGFSIVEVTMAAVVFSITAIGIITTISVLRAPSAESERRTVAAYYGQQLLEDLRAKVDQRIWASGDLSIGNHTFSNAINGKTYTASYIVTEVYSGGPRRVALTVDWTEP